MNPNLAAESIFDGKYRIERVLGSGGVGIVYKALEIELNRPVAIKILKIWSDALDQDDSLRRFQREAKVLCQLLHPNILRVYRFGIEDSVPFLVMEYVKGESLKTLILRQGPLNYQLAIVIALKLSQALAYAHEHGIVHRDLKPENVLINLESAEPTVKLIDFGLCKPESNGSSTLQKTLTNTGFLVGTALYMSPEQAKGQAVDERTDIYSFACLLFEMLTGKAAFSDLSTPEILMKQLNDPLPRILQMSPQCGLPAQVDELIQSCGQKNQSKRPQNFEEIIDVLVSLKSLPVDKKFIAPKSGIKGLSQRKLIGIGACLIFAAGGIAAAVQLGSNSFLQTVTLPEEAAKNSLAELSTLIKEKKIDRARIVAEKSTSTETFKSWPETQKADLFFKYFQAFRDANDRNTAVQYMARFLKSGLNVLSKEKEPPENWQENLKEVSQYVLSEKLSKANWRVLAETLDGPLWSRDYPGPPLAAILIGEIYEESLVRSRSNNEKVILEYNKRMINLAEMAADEHVDDKYFDRYINNALRMIRKSNDLSNESLAYAVQAYRAAQRSQIKEAIKWKDLSETTYEKFKNTTLIGEVKLSSKQHLLQLQQRYETAMAEYSQKSGATNEAKIHAQKAQELQAAVSDMQNNFDSRKATNKVKLKEVLAP